MALGCCRLPANQHCVRPLLLDRSEDPLKLRRCSLLREHKNPRDSNRPPAYRTGLSRLRTKSLVSHTDIENRQPETARAIGRISPKIQKIAPQRFRKGLLIRGNVAPIFSTRTSPIETGLVGWAYRTRTARSVREPPNWICVTISPEVSAGPAAETRRIRAALCGFAAPANSAGDL